MDAEVIIKLIIVLGLPAFMCSVAWWVKCEDIKPRRTRKDSKLNKSNFFNKSNGEN